MTHAHWHRCLACGEVRPPSELKRGPICRTCWVERTEVLDRERAIEEIERVEQGVDAPLS
jgi:hypothetical protein